MEISRKTGMKYMTGWKNGFKHLFPVRISIVRIRSGPDGLVHPVGGGFWEVFRGRITGTGKNRRNQYFHLGSENIRPCGGYAATDKKQMANGGVGEKAFKIYDIRDLFRRFSRMAYMEYRTCRTMIYMYCELYVH